MNNYDSTWNDELNHYPSWKGRSHLHFLYKYTSWNIYGKQVYVMTCFPIKPQNKGGKILFTFLLSKGYNNIKSSWRAQEIGIFGEINVWLIHVIHVMIHAWSPIFLTLSISAVAMLYTLILFAQKCIFLSLFFPCFKILRHDNKGHGCNQCDKSFQICLCFT